MSSSPTSRSESPTTYAAQEQDTSIRAFCDDVLDAIGVQNLVDVRPPGQFRFFAAVGEVVDLAITV